MTRSYKPWTKKEEMLLEDMTKQGLSCAEIADVLDRTRSSIYNRAQALNLYIQYPAGGHNGAGPSLPNEVIYVIEVLANAGVDSTTIVQTLRRQFRVSARYVRYIREGAYRTRVVERPAWK